MTRRGGPWLFAVVAAGALYALHIHRYTWTYEGIIVGVALVALLIKRVSISVRGKDGPGEEPAGEVTTEHSGVDQVFRQTPGSESGSEGDH